ncbi:MAG: hypothetical protein R6U25_00905 [Alkalispirochaeta sp.]
MAPVQTWLDRWVQVERNVPRSTSRYPDDVDCPPGPGRPISAAGGDPAPGGDPATAAGGAPAAAGVFAGTGDRTSPAAPLAGFHHRTRRRRELGGLSLAELSALGGASEARAAGCLSIRDDLPAAEYLSVPFVRRAWRLVWLLDDGGGVHFEFGRSASPDDHDEPPGLQAISFDWRLARSLDMDPRTAQCNLRRLLQILLATGFLDERDPHGLSCRTYELLCHGQVGSFYKALLLRMFNRYPWGFHDGLPPLAFVQYNALFLTWMLIRAGDHGITPEELQHPLAVLAQQRSLPSDEINWSEDAQLVARALQERYLSRVGRMLGFCQEAPTSCASEPSPGKRYQATGLAGRVLQWQVQLHKNTAQNR